ncbi:hypothetical protein RFI_00946 [Reticulomyxa filosa]|uniref:Caspase family p20 domain-containing protein n=1 Tax=Reticulomyxa filosa TaxID=46433 RepID=X6PC70_RETFI|nr:hypothetical protein RFI_00946 [Reticulomyxa filosa]|eukprot:ETO36115.1 hypothetical protein RFI_00946 [Reticulomyxa filosa]
MSKALVKIGSKKYGLKLTTVTVAGLREQIIEVSKNEQRGNVLTRVVDSCGNDIETNQHLRRLVKDGRLLFFAEFQPNVNKIRIESTKKKDVEEKKEATTPLASSLLPSPSSPLPLSPLPLLPSCHEMKNPLVLLTGAMKYKKMTYLQNAKHDLIYCKNCLSKNLVINESLTLNDLNKFILKYALNLNDNSPNKKSYDGLIFVWCGYGNNGDIVITSDEKKKPFKDIQEDFVMKTDYFVGKPKIFMKIEFTDQQNLSSSSSSSTRIKNTKEIKSNENKIRYNQDVDIFTICASIPKKSIINKSEIANKKKKNILQKFFAK